MSKRFKNINNPTLLMLECILRDAIRYSETSDSIADRKRTRALNRWLSRVNDTIDWRLKHYRLPYYEVKWFPEYSLMDIVDNNVIDRLMDRISVECEKDVEEYIKHVMSSPDETTDLTEKKRKV